MDLQLFLYVLVVPVVGFGFGLYAFFRGFFVYRKYLFLIGLPKIPIRSAPIGLVQVRGKAKWTEALPSPYKGTPCLFYQVEICRRGTTSWNNRPPPWKHYYTDRDWRRFYLEDETGRILVDAPNAVINLEKPTEMEDFLAGFGENVNALYVDALMDYMPKRIEAIRHSPLPEAEKQARLACVYQWNGLGGPFRLVEKCILPGQGYTVIGTCVENPKPEDGFPKILVKGQNNPMFEIASLTAPVEERKLHREALGSILLGAGLAVAGLGIFLYVLHVFFGWS